MKFGIQNPVTAWDDPWHPEACKTLMRTGDKQYFPSHEPTPGKKEFIDFVLNTIGVDFIMHHVMPDNAEIETLIEDFNKYGVEFMLGNEFGNANKICTPGTNRYDIPQYLVEKAKNTGKFLGLLYDESEHLQMNNLIYGDEYEGVYQWVDPKDMSLSEIEDAFVKNVSDFVKKAGCDVYSEVLFATMYHAFNHAGALLSFKTLQMAYPPLHFAVGMGAARQYNKKVCATVDTWGPDIGEWFMRLWGLPGHKPSEFANALKMTWYFSPDLMFVENCDPLITNTKDGLQLLEYGKIYKDFLAEYKGKELLYCARDILCDVAVIRSDDGVFSKSGTFYGAGPYGSRHLKNNKKTNSFFDVMHILSHKTITNLGSTMFSAGVPFPCSMFPRDEETIKSFPWPQGKAHDDYVHNLFYPLKNILVFDSFADYECLKECKAVIVCGSRLSPDTVEAIRRKAGDGAKILAAEWFKSELDGIKGIMFFDDFLLPEFEKEIAPFMGSDREWNAKFNGYGLTITNPSGDKNTLDFNLIKGGK